MQVLQLYFHCIKNDMYKWPSYLRQGGYVFTNAGLFVCLSICAKDYLKSKGRIFINHFQPVSIQLGLGRYWSCSYSGIGYYQGWGCSVINRETVACEHLHEYGQRDIAEKTKQNKKPSCSNVAVTQSSRKSHRMTLPLIMLTDPNKSNYIF